MSTLRIALGTAIMLVGCTPIDPAQNTFPQQPEPTTVAGPPGGGMDPQYGSQYGASQQPYYQQAPQQVAQAPDQGGYPAGYPDGGYGPSTEEQAAAGTDGYGTGDVTPAPSLDPNAVSDDPNAANYGMGQVTDTEIDATLDGYGQWEETDDYGRVWRPDTTAVGVDFTPYETCGSWLWSDAGWNFQCDWDWGWLPFHYGRWGWFDGYWGWQPGYTWSSGAVEWRGGGGYTGWRPLAPIVRDHRGNHAPIVRDHRGESQWRFAADKDFGHGHIRGHLFQNPAEGLRVTTTVKAPSFKGNYAPVASSSIMRGRFSTSARTNSYNVPGRANTSYQSGSRPSSRPAQSFQQNPARGNTPTWRPQQSQGYQQGYRAPTTSYGNRQYPSTYRPAYRPPASSGYNRPSYSGGGRTYSPPASTGSFHSSGGSSGHYSAPSHSSSSGGSFHSSGSSGSSHSSGGGGSFHSSGGGGGGHHR
ncbi:MAG: hypothetical protein QM831_30310 [Kofleriaceae bacterium]